MSKDITVDYVADKLSRQEQIILLDVREHDEHQRAKIDDARVRYLPMSVLAQKGVQAFPRVLLEKNKEIIVFCHHGHRSSQVVKWMLKMGWQKVYNMMGGINEYASRVDPTIGSY